MVIRDESMSGIPMGIPMGIGSTVLVEWEWNEKYGNETVSYTHLTLPTNREV